MSGSPPAPVPPRDAPRSLFPSTHWSAVLTAGGSGSSVARTAWDQLAQTYWQPVYSHARRRGYSRDFPSALDWLGRIYWRQGRFRESLKLQEELLGTRHRLHGRDKETTRWAVRDLTTLHARIGQWQQAAALSAELIRFSEPESCDLIGAVIIHELAGNPGAARETLLAELGRARGRMDSTNSIRADCLGLFSMPHGARLARGQSL